MISIYLVLTEGSDLDQEGYLKSKLEEQGTMNGIFVQHILDMPLKDLGIFFWGIVDVPAYNT